LRFSQSTTEVYCAGGGLGGGVTGFFSRFRLFFSRCFCGGAFAGFD